MMDDMRERVWSKVPEVTLAFWIIKIARDDARRDRRRHGHDDADLGLS